MQEPTEKSGAKKYISPWQTHIIENRKLSIKEKIKETLTPEKAKQI